MIRNFSITKYLLTEDVVNPCPDKRYNSLLKQPVIKKGTILLLRQYDDDLLTDEKKWWTISTLYIHPDCIKTLQDSYTYIRSDSMLYAEIMRVAQLIPENTCDVVRRIVDGKYIEVLAVLIDKNKIKIQDIEQAVKEVKA